MKSIAIRAGGLLLAFSSMLATAESINPVLDDKFSFRLGAIYNDIDGTVTVARAPLPVTPVDIEKALGIDSNQTSPWLALRWRFRERWSLNFRFDRWDQSGGGIVGDSFNLDGQPYPVGAFIETDLRADAYILDVSYNLWQSNNYEAGIGLGLHAFDIEISAEGGIIIGDIEEDFDPTNESLIAPVPNLRLYGTYAFNEKTSFTANAGWLSLTYEDYEGSFLYIRGEVEYRFSERWGAGLGAQYTDIDVEHDSGDGDFEEMDVNFTGVTAYVSYSF